MTWRWWPMLLHEMSVAFRTVHTGIAAASDLVEV